MAEIVDDRPRRVPNFYVRRVKQLSNCSRDRENDTGAWLSHGRCASTRLEEYSNRNDKSAPIQLPEQSEFGIESLKSL